MGWVGFEAGLEQGDQGAIHSYHFCLSFSFICCYLNFDDFHIYNNYHNYFFVNKILIRVML